MGHALRKRVFGHMRAVKAGISLRICVVLSRPSLAANRIIGYYRLLHTRDQRPGGYFALAQDESECAFCACSKTFSLWEAHLQLIGSESIQLSSVHIKYLNTVQHTKRGKRELITELDNKEHLHFITFWSRSLVAAYWIIKYRKIYLWTASGCAS